MEPKEFGQYLKSLRERRGLTMRKLDQLSGVSHSYISQMERGERGVPKPDILKKLAGPLGVDYSELMYKAGHINTPMYWLLDDEEVDEELNKNKLKRLVDWLEDDNESLEEKKISLADWLTDDDPPTELTDFLQQPGITYNGRQLDDQDRSRILDMLAVLFPDRK